MSVLDAISFSSEKENIAKKLQEILTWFNHDLVAHGTFFPTKGIDENIIRSGDNNIAEIFEHRTNTLQDDVFKSAFAGELWSLNLHESIYKRFIEQRPAIARFLRAHLDNYIRSVEIVVKDIIDTSFAEDVKNYLLKVYSFGFFRLVDPKDFKEQELFLKIRNNYSKLPDLGNKEDSARKFTFGEQGLIGEHKGKTSFIPHEKVFQLFTESFEKT